MILSVIDIGTNTILMLTVQTHGPRVEILADEHSIVRVGEGVDATRLINQAAFERATKQLLLFHESASRLGSEKIVAFATSAVRDASNRGEFISEMRRQSGIDIEVLSSEEESQRTFHGALYGLMLTPEKTIVLDIGGGSTEIALGSDGRLEKSKSIDIGAVRISERFFPSLPPTCDQIQAAREYIREQFECIYSLPPHTTTVGVAGTVTTLGAIYCGQENFNADELNGLRIPRQFISEQVQRISGYNRDITAAIPQISSGRADIILAGAIILEEFLHFFQLHEIVVSTRGVRYGVMLRELATMQNAR